MKKLMKTKKEEAKKLKPKKVKKEKKEKIKKVKIKKEKVKIRKPKKLRTKESKIGKKGAKKVLFILFILFGLVLLVSQLGNLKGANKQSSSSKSKSYLVKIHTIADGIPASEQTLTYVNYQKLYQKIQTGEFTEEDLALNQWRQFAMDLGESYEATSVPIDENLRFGMGETNTPEDARRIIKKLILGDHLELMNLLSRGLPTPPLNNKFHIPGNPSLHQTDENGNAEATISEGVTAIFFKGKFLRLVDINEESKDFSFNLDGGSTEVSIVLEDSTEGSNVVEYNQEITYTVTVNKSVLENGAHLRLNLQAFFAVDEISIPHQKNILLPSNNKLTVSAVQEVLETSGLYNYTMDIEPQDTDLTFTIKGHLMPLSNYTSKILGGKTITEYASRQKTGGYFFSITTEAAGIPTTSVRSPNIYITGLNFVTIDAKGEPVYDGKYLFGKKQNDKYSILTEEGNWQEVSSKDVKDGTLEDENFQILEGGKAYNIGQTKEELERSKGLSNISKGNLFNRWRLIGAEEIRTIESEIQITGLSANSEYFLYTYSLPEGYTKNNEIVLYRPFYKIERSPSGKTIYKTSSGYASNQNYKINTKLLNYSAGNREFNAVYAGSRTPVKFGPYIRVWGSLLIATLFIGLLTHIFLKYID